ADDGLVPGPRAAAAILLRAGEPARCAARREHRSGDAGPSDCAQGDQGRLLPVRAQLLSALHPCRAHRAARRYSHLPCWSSLHHAAEWLSGFIQKRGRRVMSSATDHAVAKAIEAPQVDKNRGTFSRRNLLVGGASLAAAAAALPSMSGITPALAQA